jgi:NADH-quinone oxidoreductase subunit N
VMVSGANLLVLYVGLELQALCLYAMVAMNRDNAQSSEAAMKYFILGALASGLLLYGMSMIYGATGSLDIAAVYKAANSPTVNKTLLVLGVVFVVSAIAFKLGAVPYHMCIKARPHRLRSSLLACPSSPPSRLPCVFSCKACRARSTIGR